MTFSPTDRQKTDKTNMSQHPEGIMLRVLIKILRGRQGHKICFKGKMRKIIPDLSWTTGHGS